MPIEKPRAAGYEELAARLRARINSGEWRPGERIPSHRKLMDHYGVSDAMLSRARAMLITEGILESRGGAGVYVRLPAERRRILRSDPGRPGGPALSLRQQEDSAGRIEDWDFHSQATRADRDIAALLRIPLASEVMETSYQYRVAGQLVRLTTVWEPYSLVGPTSVILPEDGPLAGYPVRDRMAAISVELGDSEDCVVARPCTVPEARLLGCGAGAAVLEVTRVERSVDGQPVHVERSVVRADTGMLVYRLPRN